MVEHHRGEAARLEAEGDGAESAKNWAAALDACAMAQDDQLAAELTDDVPDPYDHVGRGSAHDLLRSHSAFDRARRIDQNDATALRGLADSEDRQAVDPAHVEELFRRVVELEPQDAPSHRRLVGVLLAAGRPQAAVDAFEQAAGALVGVLDENHFADDLLLPVARLAVAAGNLPLAARAATVACRTIELPEVREVDRLVAALIEAIEYGEFVAPQRLGTCWWKEPQLLGDFDFDHRPLTRWLAARVDGIDGDDASIHYADVSVSAQQRPERYWTSIAIDGLRVLSLDALPDPLPGAILEVGIYGDQVGPESTVVRVAETEEIVLPEPALSLDRYARN
jgi:tetratricopeptide (TPR) repeat protein